MSIWHRYTTFEERQKAKEDVGNIPELTLISPTGRTIVMSIMDIEDICWRDDDDPRKGAVADTYEYGPLGVDTTDPQAYAIVSEMIDPS